MIRTKMLADGVMEIRLIGDDGKLDAVVELTRPSDHSLLIAHLLDWQDECRERAAAFAHVEPRVLPFPVRVQKAV